MDSKLRGDVVKALTGTSVHVLAGPILKDVMQRELVQQGAEDVIDRLRARGYTVKEMAE